MKLKTILRNQLIFSCISSHTCMSKAYLAYKVKIIVLIHPTLIHMCCDLVCQSILLLQFSALLPCTRSMIAFE